MPQSGSEDHCPYGEPPTITVESDTFWRINDAGRNEAPQDCQPILIDPRACDTCPLNPYRGGKERPEPSQFIQQILTLDEYMQAGVSFEFDSLQRVEWRGLALLKRKRDEKQIKDLKRK